MIILFGYNQVASIRANYLLKLSMFIINSCEMLILTFFDQNSFNGTELIIAFCTFPPGFEIFRRPIS